MAGVPLDIDACQPRTVPPLECAKAGGSTTRQAMKQTEDVVSGEPGVVQGREPRQPFFGAGFDGPSWRGSGNADSHRR